MSNLSSSRRLMVSRSQAIPVNTPIPASQRFMQSRGVWMVLVLLAGSLTGLAAESSAHPQLIPAPSHGFISNQQAAKWEESMLTGNGSLGALVPGDPLKERIIWSHEKLFLPEYPPTPAPPLHRDLDRLRELARNGEGEAAAELAAEIGEEVGIEGMIWTDPLVPACQLEIQGLNGGRVTQYERSVNYATGEATAAWQKDGVTFRRSVFVSRDNGLGVVRMTASQGGSLNVRIRLSQLPIPGESNDPDESPVAQLIEKTTQGAKNNTLHFSTQFRRQWEGSLKGYAVAAAVYAENGAVETDEGWMEIRGAKEILALVDLELSYQLPLRQPDSPLMQSRKPDYDELLAANTKIQSEMFQRFGLELGGASPSDVSAEDLLASSKFGALNPALVTQLCKASRYALICSSGELPPTLQGIWGGTWRPAWSSDYTLNGNVPSAIACGLNSNLLELTESYLDYMWSMVDEFRTNARELYKAPGLFVPSRCSSSGSTYHYGEQYPHLFWYAGGAWTAHFFYDYWLHTHDLNFLKQRAIPFMVEAAEFYEQILVEGADGQLHFIPSYSPEVGPQNRHPLAINAVMDIAALKQLLRNLLRLSDSGLLQSTKNRTWKQILIKLPHYAVDSHGDFKEWIWPDYENNNQHRHVSHLYPLFYEVDPEIAQSPLLQAAAIQAIENRLDYRRDKNGAEMAFGLVQLGLSAAHLRDTSHAYECVDWLCNSYWSPALTSYHNPGRIFNVDICGGLPAVVVEMLIQSSADTIELLPALPKQWPQGRIHGALTRSGVQVDMTWNNQAPTHVTLTATRETTIEVRYGNEAWPLVLDKGQIHTMEMR